MARERRELGKELFTFIDGSTKEVSIHAVANFEMMKLKRQFRKHKLTKKGDIDSVDFEDENYTLSVIKLATGAQLSREDLEECETDIKKIYDKYFTNKLSAEKKPTSTDTSEQNQDNESKE